MHREIKKNLVTANVGKADVTVGQTGTADRRETSRVTKMTVRNDFAFGLAPASRAAVS